jgi:hypothetical protein
MHICGFFATNMHFLRIFFGIPTKNE